MRRCGGNGEERQVSRREPERSWVGRALVTVAALSLLWAGWLGIWHGYHWVRYGAGAPYSTRQLFVDLGIGHPSTTWVGLQRVVDGIMAWPAALFLLFAGLALAVVGGNVIERRRVRARTGSRRGEKGRRARLDDPEAAERERRKREEIAAREAGRQSFHH